MARTNNLTNFLTDVATAIKTKTGDSTLIPASQFDTKIANISTGHLDNTEYAEANDDLDDILEGSTPTTIYPPDWSEIGYSDTPQSIIDAFNYAKDIYDNWDSTITDMTRKYINNKNLNYFPLVNTSNVTAMTQAFDTSDIQSIDAINTSKVLYFTQAFQNCNYLKDVPVFNFSSVTSTSNLYRMFYQCNRLTDTSLNNILASCILATNIITGTKTLKYIGLTQAQAETCQTLSNYQAFLDAGWTTGY